LITRSYVYACGLLLTSGRGRNALARLYWCCHLPENLHCRSRSKSANTNTGTLNGESKHSNKTQFVIIVLCSLTYFGIERIMLHDVWLNTTE